LARWTLLRRNGWHRPRSVHKVGTDPLGHGDITREMSDDALRTVWECLQPWCPHACKPGPPQAHWWAARLLRPQRDAAELEPRQKRHCAHQSAADDKSCWKSTPPERSQETLSPGLTRLRVSLLRARPSVSPLDLQERACWPISGLNPSSCRWTLEVPPLPEGDWVAGGLDVLDSKVIPLVATQSQAFCISPSVRGVKAPAVEEWAPLGYTAPAELRSWTRSCQVVQLYLATAGR
jgi:hypothetical protein